MKDCELIKLLILLANETVLAIIIFSGREMGAPVLYAAFLTVSVLLWFTLPFLMKKR